MKTKEQIEKKIESLKTDFIEKFAFDNDNSCDYAIVYQTLKWVLDDKENVINIGRAIK